MKTNEKKELHTKPEAELQKMLKDNREQLMKLKLEQAQAKLKNTSELSNVRRTIAMLMTILNEKEMIKNG